MLLQKKKSALVRLSDCIKLGIGNCLDTTNAIIDLYMKYEEPIQEIGAIAKAILEDRISAEEGKKKKKKLLEVKKISEEDARREVSLEGRLHSECLSVILNCCFALESYVNSLGYYVLQEKDFLSLFREGHEATAEVLIDAIEKIEHSYEMGDHGKTQER